MKKTGFFTYVYFNDVGLSTSVFFLMGCFNNVLDCSKKGEEDGASGTTMRPTLPTHLSFLGHAINHVRPCREMRVDCVDKGDTHGLGGSTVAVSEINHEECCRPACQRPPGHVAGALPQL